MKRLASLALVVLLGSSTAALAGGLLLYEVGTPEVGLASAGWAARAEDASTILTNPAGMTRLTDHDLMVGLQALYADIAFTPSADTTTEGGYGGNPVGWFPGGSLFYVHPASDRLRLGIGVAGDFGSALQYDDGWVGRYYVQRAKLLGVSVLPAIAWKINDEVSIGAAVNATYGTMETRVAVNNILPQSPDGGLKLTDSTWGFGGNVGLLVEPKEGTRFGLTYTSPVKLDFRSTPEFTSLAPGMSGILGAAGLLDVPLDLLVKVPQTVMASFVHRLSDRWTILGNAGWQQWSDFGKVDVQVSSDTPTSLTVSLNYKDTWHGAIGAEVKTRSPWAVTFGAAYDSSCVDDADRTPTLPLGAAWRVGVGGRRPMGSKLDFGMAYELAWGGDLPVDQQRGPLSGRLAGSYEKSAMHFFGASFRWKL